MAARSGVVRRHSVLPRLFGPRGFYGAPGSPGTAARMEVYRREAGRLARKACAPLVAQARPTHLLVTSCTGFYTPGIDVDLVRGLGLDPAISRFTLGYMGCHAAVSGLSLASSIVRADRRARVLMVNLELCSLHLPPPEAPLAELVPALLFSDGCAAGMISRESRGLRIGGFAFHALPEKAEFLRWKICDHGFRMRVSAELPQRLASALQDWRGHFIPRRGLKLYAIHPGGPRILDEVAEALALTPAELAPSRAVLRANGNMSSASLLFILRRVLESKKRGPGLALAFGPGLTLAGMRFVKP